MLKEYVQDVKTKNEEIKSIALICKKYLIKLYEDAGFKYAGESPVVHGKEQWYEMRID